MTKREAKNFGYEVRVGSCSQFNNATISIIRLGRHESAICKLTFQSNASTPSSWYAGRAVIEAGNIEDIAEAQRVLRPLAKPGWSQWLDSGDQVPELLAKLKRTYTEVTYDSRLSEYVPVEEITEPDWRRYMALDSEGRCMYSTVAPDERKAKEDLLTKMAPALAGDYCYRKDDILSWMQSPAVTIDESCKTPDARCAQEKMFLAPA